MSDFLMRFGLRALGVGGEIRPAVAPLFLSHISGPAADDPGRSQGNALLDEEREPNAAGTTAPKSPVRRRPPESLSHSPAVIREAAPSLPRPENPLPRAPDPGTRLATAFAPGGACLPLREHEPISQSAPASAEERSPVVAGEVDRGPVAPRFTLRPRQTAHAESVPLRESLIVPDRGRDHTLPSTAEREISAALSRLQRLNSTREPSVAGSAPEEKIVRISIGRIDVRAVSAPPPASESPQTRRERRPTPSLAEYLAGKGRGTA
jgi:hypothetical protein